MNNANLTVLELIAIQKRKARRNRDENLNKRIIFNRYDAEIKALEELEDKIKRNKTTVVSY